MDVNAEDSKMSIPFEILFEDNHLLIVNKPGGVLSQGDNTGDPSIIDLAKKYVKEKYDKPGNVFIGLPHRLDRPSSGVIVLCKTSKSLSRMSELFKQKAVSKKYWAVVKESLANERGMLTHYLLKTEKNNKSKAYKNEIAHSKKAELEYNLIAKSDNFNLLEINLISGRHHQIRAQLSASGSPIKGDVKYGYKRANEDACIHLHAREIAFIHPVTKQALAIKATPPNEKLWQFFVNLVGG